MATLPENARTIFSYLRGQGLSFNAAAGIVGNIGQESGGDPSAGVWPSNYGLIQWTPANAYFAAPPSFSQQLAAIIAYINANGSVADVNANASSPAAAALYFSERYERPAAWAANNPNREAVAQLVAEAAQSGDWSASPGGTTPGSTTTPATLTRKTTQPGGTQQPSSSSTVPSGALTAVDMSRLQYMALVSTYGPDLFDANSALNAELAARQQQATLTSADLTSWFSKLGGPLWALIQGMFPGESIAAKAAGGGASGISGAVSGAENIISGEETIASHLMWILQPVHMLRALEVLDGAILMGIGLSLYISVLVPGIGGLVGTVAAVAAPEVAGATSLRGAARSVGRARAGSAQQRQSAERAEQRRRAAEEASERRITEAEARAAARRYGRERSRPGRSYTPGEQAPEGEEWF